MQFSTWRSGLWAALAVPLLAAAQAPELLGYQGRLIRNSGMPESGATEMKFSFYAVATGGTALWEEEQALNLADGYYATYLGKSTPFGATLFDNGTLYLEISVKAQGDFSFKTMTPRQRVGSVAFALSAKNVKGGTVDATRVTIAGNPAVAVNISGCTSGQVLQWNGTDWVCVTPATGGTNYSAGKGITIDANNAISVSSGGCTAGQLLQWNGSTWVCGQVTGMGTGSVTSVGTGAGLTGGPITGIGTISVATGGISSAHLANGAVTAAKLGSNGCGVNDVLRWNGAAWVCLNLDYGRTPTNPGSSCRDIKLKAPWSMDGLYLVDIDGPTGALPFQVYCDMTRDGGGWTLIMRNWYQCNLAGRADGFGSPHEANMPKYEPYKLADATIRAIIGSDNNFDLLADQLFHNTAYSSGNFEYIVVRNYTGAFTYLAPMEESTTETVFESYRAYDNSLMWRGRLGCGPVEAPTGGYGINCNSVLTTPNPVGAANPQGGAGCLGANASTDPSWHTLFMGHTNSDTYQYLCNGAQHTSSYSNVHRWWVR